MKYFPFCVSPPLRGLRSVVLKKTIAEILIETVLETLVI